MIATHDVGGGHGQDEVEDVGLVAELEALGLAEVVAVDLVRERAVAGDRERASRSVRSSVQRRAAQVPCPVPSAEPTIAQRSWRTPSVRSVTTARPRSSVASGATSSGRLPRYVYGFVLRHDREVAVVDHRAVGEAHGEAGPAAVVVAEPGGRTPA